MLGRGQERGEEEKPPCKSVGKVGEELVRAAMGGGVLERGGLERRGWRELGQLQTLVLQHWNREQNPTKSVLDILLFSVN